MFLAPPKTKRFRPPATVGAHPVRDALALGAFKGKSFRLPAAAELLSLCVLKEKVTKEKEHPASALSGPPARKVRGRATGFVDRASGNRSCVASTPASMPSPALTPNWPASLPATLRAFLRPPAAAEGAPVEQRAVVARTVHKSQIKSFPLTPTLSPGKAGGEGAGAAAPCSCCCSALAFAFASDFAFAVLKSAGHDGPLLYRGPCAAVRRGRQAAQRASAWMPMPFRQGRMPCRKARPRLTDLLGMARAWMPELRQRRSGCPMAGLYRQG